MKRFWFGALLLLGAAILTFWITSEQGVWQPEEFAAPPPPSISQRPASAGRPIGSDRTEIANTPSISDGPRPNSDPETAIYPSVVVSEVAGAAVVAVPILPGIELSGDMQALHGVLEKETKDYSWSVPMETELYKHFLENSQRLAKNFALPNVECRTTICEIQAIGYGQGSLEAWEAATSDLDSQPWAEEFIEMRLTGNYIGPDVGGVVLILVRRSGEVTVQSVGGSVATI